MRDEVLAYYRRGGERVRLAAGAGRWEFLRTWDLLTRTLPPPPARVLDVGGAMGVYAGPLARAGYQVRLIDPVPEHVAEAGTLDGVTAEVGDVRTLDLADASVDAVLLLGPLYHLIERAERVRAWQEAARVVRPGGVVLAAMISRFASLLDGFVKDYASAGPVFLDMVRVALETGVHRNPAGHGWFTTAYFHHPAEVPDEVAAAGLDLARLAAVEGPLWMMGDLDTYLTDPARTTRMLESMRAVESEPSLLGSSSHLLAVARRPY